MDCSHIVSDFTLFSARECAPLPRPSTVLQLVLGQLFNTFRRDHNTPKTPEPLWIQNWMAKTPHDCVKFIGSLHESPAYSCTIHSTEYYDMSSGGDAGDDFRRGGQDDGRRDVMVAAAVLVLS